MIRPLRSRLLFERLEDRHLLSATVFQHGDVGYFLRDQPPSIERYDVAHESWLSPISLTGAIGSPTVALVDDDGIYVAYGKAVYRYALDGKQQTHLINAQDDVIALHSDGHLLFVNHTSGLYARFLSFDKDTNTLVDTMETYVDSMYGSSIAPDRNRIFGRTDGVSPSDIVYAAYDDEGNLNNSVDSPYHGDFPGASRTWVFPSGSKVVDDSGTIYSTDSLTRLNSFGSTIDNIGFLAGEIPIILSGNTLTAYSNAILPTGSKTLDDTPSNIFVNDTNVVTFTADAGSPTGYRATLVPVADLNPPAPGQPVDPNGLAYTPDAIEVAADGTVLLFSKSHESIFRWNPITESYATTIPLIGAAEFMAYSAETDTVYLAYASGLIRKIDLTSSDLSEKPFAALPDRPLGLATAGSFVFAVDPSGAWVSHYTLASNGSVIESVELNYYSQEYRWSDANQKMYFFRDDTSPNDLLWEEINADGATYPSEPLGGIGLKMDSPLHGEGGFEHPIRVAPDGSIVVLGSGRVYDARTLEPSPYALANSITDAAWLGGELLTVRNISGGHQYQRWSSPTYGQGAVAQFPGDALALASTPDGRLIGISRDSGGIPEFRLMNANFAAAPPAFDFGDAPTSLQSGFVQSYPTQIADNGARHNISSLYLGSRIDLEMDGQPDGQAGAGGGGDDADADDEDGVRLLATMVARADAATGFSLAVTASRIGKIDAWVDFNRNGDWSDPGEQILASVTVSGGSTAVLPATVPPGSAVGNTFMRVRLSSAGGLQPTGYAADGEVEEYLVTILDGDALGVGEVQVDFPFAGTVAAFNEGNSAVVSMGPIELFRGPAGSSRVVIRGTPDDDTLNFAGSGNWLAADTGLGHDTLRLTGGGQMIDLPQIGDADLQGIEEIDLTASVGNRLVLNFDEVLNISPTNHTLRVVHGGDDAVLYGTGWTVAMPRIVGNQFMHVLKQGAATVEIVNATPYRNPFQPLDVNRDGGVSAVDALNIINRLNAGGSAPLVAPASMSGVAEYFYYDANGDRVVAPIDALLVVNFLNAPRGGPEGEGTSEIVAVAGSISPSWWLDSPGPTAPTFGAMNAIRNPRSSDASDGIVLPFAAAVRGQAALGTGKLNQTRLAAAQHSEEYLAALDEVFSSDELPLWDAIVD